MYCRTWISVSEKPLNFGDFAQKSKSCRLATIIGCSLLGYPSQKTSMAAFFSLELTWPLGPSGQGDDFPRNTIFSLRMWQRP